jgi:hypothetical protein
LFVERLNPRRLFPTPLRRPMRFAGRARPFLFCASAFCAADISADTALYSSASVDDGGAA